MESKQINLTGNYSCNPHIEKWRKITLNIKDMTKYLLLVTLLISSIFPSLASADDKVFVCGIEQQAEFPGGMRALVDWINSNRRYPEECMKEGIEGRVIVKFKVEKDGSVSDVKVVKGVHPLLDAEAVRLTESMPRWTPGKYEGEPAASHFNLSITFKRPAEFKE